VIDMSGLLSRECFREWCETRTNSRRKRSCVTAFKDAVRQVKAADGSTGKVTFDGRLDYEAFRLADDEACVVAAREAVRTVGLAPRLEVSNGGLDANWMAANGVPTVTLGCGQVEIHTTKEQLDLDAFEAACTVALRLATDTVPVGRGG
jgi:tripeptide aminopeptidase